MKKVVAMFLCLILMMAVVPMELVGASQTDDGPIIYQMGPDDFDPLPEGYPTPGFRLWDDDDVGGAAIGDKLYTFKWSPGNPYVVESYEMILIGARLESYGVAQILFADGHVIYPIREIFSDGERLTFIFDRPRGTQAAELYLSFRLTNVASYGIMVRSYHGLVMGTNWYYDYVMDTHSSPTRPIGGGSVYDIFIENGQEWGEVGGIRRPALDMQVVPVNIPRDTTPPNPTPTDQPSSWAADLVNAAIALNLVPQHMQSNYTHTATRAEFAALAVNLYENITGEVIETGENPFTDTDDPNAIKAAAIAVTTGTGDGTTFSPDDDLTRQQAATMLSRLAAALGSPLPDSAPTFVDNASIADWAAAAVGKVQAVGIMSGIGENTFAPHDPYTREQSIMTIMRLYDTVPAAG